MYKDQDNDDNLEEHLCITNAKGKCVCGVQVGLNSSGYLVSF